MSLEKQKRVHQSVTRVPTRETKSSNSSEILFTSDRKGDPQNLTYASLDKYKVPRYRTTGYGRLLGLDRRFRVVSSSDTRRDIQDEGNDSTRKNRNVPSLTTSKITDNGVFVGMGTYMIDAVSIIEQRDFIRLNSRHNRKRRRLSASENDQAVAVIQDTDEDKSDTGESSDSLSHQGDKEDLEDNAFEQFRNHPDNVKQIELTRRTDKNPADSEAWIALIDHQERYITLSMPTNTKDTSSSSQRMLAEIRLSLYERALAKVTAPEERWELLLGYLQEGSKIWDTKIQLKQWNNVLKQNQSIDLWYRYLDLRQSNLVIFTYEQCLEVYMEVLEKIHGLDKSENTEFHVCYWTLRVTTFMLQSGFAERAIAIWQAMLEINFLTPPSMSEEHVLAAFEQFWDHETIRLGESGARGWCSSDDTSPGPSLDRELPPLDDDEIFPSWLREEEVRSRDDIMPARTLDDTLEDDPYRVIIFSDIKEFLNLMRSDAGRQYLLQAFLKFCGLPPLNDGSSECETWWSDAFLCGYRPRLLSKDSPDSSVGFKGGFVHFALESTTLFPQSNWFNVWDAVESENATLLDLASRTLTHLVESRPKHDYLAVYNVAFKFHREPAGARKYAKSLLKKRSERLPLYNAYALMEASSGKHQGAVKVWLTALSMSRSLDADVQTQSIFLWHDLILELISYKEYYQAISALLALTRSDSVDISSLTNVESATPRLPSEYLRADRFYRDHVSNALLSREWPDLDAYNSLWSMYTYLTKSYDLSEALAVFNFTIESLRTETASTMILESLHQSRARLIQLHATSSPSGYKPLELLPFLKESRTLFPNNTIFHTLHEQYARQAGLIDRLRDLSTTFTFTNSIPSTPKQERRKTQRESSLPSTLLKISLELSRPSYAGTTNHSIRSAFRKATITPSDKDSSIHIEEPPARHNPSVWLSWLDWELSLLSPSSPPSTSTTQLKQLKDLYLTSLRFCPWSKELYLLGFRSELLRHVLGTEGLKEIYFSMRERGIRVRVDLAEFFEQ